MCKQSSSRHSFNGFALEYFRPILEHSRQAFYYFFSGFLILYNFSEIGEQILLVTAQQYKKAYLTYQNVFIAETYAFFVNFVHIYRDDESIEYILLCLNYDLPY